MYLPSLNPMLSTTANEGDSYAVMIGIVGSDSLSLGKKPQDCDRRIRYFLH
jgi:hypothetical protein